MAKKDQIYCHLGDLITLKRGFDLPNQYRSEGIYPVVSSGGITGLHSRSKVVGPGVVTGRYGTLGKVFYVKDNFWPLNTTLFVEDFKENNPRFIGYLLESLNIAGQAASAAVPGVNRNVLHRLRCRRVNLRMQKRISDVLGHYDDLVENNKKRIEILEQIAQSVYTEWFINFHFPGHKHTKLIESGTSIGLIPQTWQIVKIADRFSVVLGGTPSRAKKEYWENGTIPWINSGKVNEIRIIDESELITSDALAKSATKIMPRRTTVMAITGATLGQVSLTEIDCCANQSVIGIYDEGDMLGEYIYLKIKEIIHSIVVLAGGGAQPHINKQIVQSRIVCIPDEEIAHQFSKKIRPIFDEIANLSFQNKKLLEIRGLLLPQLISGMLELKEPKAVVDGVKAVLSPYQDAVTFSVIVRDLVKTYGRNPSRFEVQKNKYFVDRFFLDDIRSKYSAMPNGPYDKTSRYKGGESIAVKSKYILKDDDTKFKAGPELQKAERYYSSKLSQVEPVLSYLRSKSDSELEILTTTDYAIVDLVSTHHKKVTAKDVLEYIKNHQIWKEKIQRLSLTEEKIIKFMANLKELSALGIRYPQT